MSNLESGAASMKVSLSKGVITVNHGDTGEVLWKSEAEQGTWSRLWDVLYNSVPLIEKDETE